MMNQYDIIDLECLLTRINVEFSKYEYVCLFKSVQNL